MSQSLNGDTHTHRLFVFLSKTKGEHKVVICLGGMQGDACALHTVEPFSTRSTLGYDSPIYQFSVPPIHDRLVHYSMIFDTWD